MIASEIRPVVLEVDSQSWMLCSPQTDKHVVK
jgi:hypothetical protein